jgi:ABC-type transport system involved in cytochrome c biogenesis permease subunit
MMPTVAFALIAVALVIQICFMLKSAGTPDPVSHYALLGAAALLIGETVRRTVKIRFVAVTNTYESLVFFSGMIVLLLFLYRLQRRLRVIPFVMFGGTLLALALPAIASSPIAPRDIAPPIPALQSYWLVLHVILAFVGEAFFTVACVASIVYLATKDETKRRSVDRIIYTTIGIGYPIFTLGALVFGAIWAQAAWGRYWNWDPKETWALVTWLTYTAYLHTRLVRKLHGTVSAVVSIVGYAFALFTFFGVNFLLPGLHSYG